MPKTRFTELIHQVAATYQLDPTLLEGQVLTESDGDPNAFRFEKAFYERYILDKPLTIAKAGAYGPFAACSVGLMQIMVEVAYELGFDGRPEQLFTPRVNLAWGARKLRRLLDWADGDIVRALCAYNGGAVGNAVRPLRNQRYADKVFRLSGR
jgi:soluble lytic murein transglycosylase-like protein